MYYPIIKHAQNALKCEIMICIKIGIFKQLHTCFKQIVFAPVIRPILRPIHRERPNQQAFSWTMYFLHENT